MTRTTVDNTQDVLDSRDIIERIEELQDIVETAESDEQTAGTVDDEKAELKALEALQEEAEGCSPDWKYGSQLIRESYFVEYSKELLADIGDLPKDLPSYIAIDWEETADNLKVDYTEVEFDGVTYLIR